MTAISLPRTDVVLSHPDGDQPAIDTRFVVAPATGTFRPLPPANYTTEGEIVDDGDVLGHIHGPTGNEPVTSFCSAFLLRFFVEPGERVRTGQRIAWLHPLDRPATRPVTSRSR